MSILRTRQALTTRGSVARRRILLSTSLLALILLPTSIVQAVDAPAPLQKEFFKAVGRGDIERVSALLAQSVDVNTDFGGMTAIMIAGDPDMVKLLANEGADVNARSDLLNMTVLVSSVSKGKVDVVNALLEAGADVNSRDEKTGATALSMMMTSGKVDIIEVLIEAGADVNAVGLLGMRPLSLAVMAGKANIVDILIENEADVNAKDEDGSSPLNRAVSMRKTDIVKALVDAGADVNTSTILDLANLTGDESIQELLRKAGARKSEVAPELDFTKANPAGIYTLECNNTKLVLLLEANQGWQGVQTSTRT